MKIFKYLLYLLLGLLAILIIAGLFIQKEVKTERTVVMDAPVSEIYDYVIDLKKWDEWSPWRELDPAMKKTYGDVTKGKGATYKWSGKKAGKGYLTITDGIVNESIKTRIDFRGNGTAYGYWKFNALENGSTEVTRGLTFDVPFPMNIMTYFMEETDGMGKDYEKGLNKIKSIMEESSKMYNGYHINELNLPEQHFIGIRKELAMSGIQDFYRENIGMPFMAAEDAGLEVVGMPLGLYFSWDTIAQKTDLMVAVPVKEKAELEGFEYLSMPAGKLLQVDYIGNYDGIGKAHEAIDQYIVDNNLEKGYPIIEQYLSDPAQEPDSSKWLTKIYYPVK